MPNLGPKPGFNVHERGFSPYLREDTAPEGTGAATEKELLDKFSAVNNAIFTILCLPFQTIVHPSL